MTSSRRPRDTPWTRRSGRRTRSTCWRYCACRWPRRRFHGRALRASRSTTLLRCSPRCVATPARSRCIATPARPRCRHDHIPLLAFLEDAVHPVTPPKRGGRVSSEAVASALHARAPRTPVWYRLLVLSRNLTFDRSWDVALILDGELLDRQRRSSPNRPLAEFFAALPAMAQAAGHDLPSGAAAIALSCSPTEVRRVEWSLPEAFDDIAFHPIGHDGKPYWPDRGPSSAHGHLAVRGNPSARATSSRGSRTSSAWSAASMSSRS